MPIQADTGRLIWITTPLPDDTFLLQGMSGRERLGRMFEYQLDLRSDDASIAFDDLLGKNVTVTMDLPDGGERYWNGYVTNLAQTGDGGLHETYQATMRPWLWFLTRTADCRIFQNASVPEILQSIFREHGFTDFRDDLDESYRTWVYCVQYRETDFNFVSRLMEQEGIYYYFEHEDGKHTLVMADSYGAHEKRSGCESIPFVHPGEGAEEQGGCITGWRTAQAVQPGKFALNDYDFEAPSANLQVLSSKSSSYSHGDHEIYDYPGEYLKTTDGDYYVRARMEEFHAQQKIVGAQSNVRGQAVGDLFSLSEYPREDQNAEYLIVSQETSVSNPSVESGGGGSGVFSSSLEIIPSKQRYVSARITPKTMIRGPQTAKVVGKLGEEIWTDKYGRVKVQFHWDRYGKSDENSSCWVRVAQVWAGKTWGGIMIPRMGQEVIVEFMEGDPDQPIITGRVYNKEQMPPYVLPADQTQSGIKTRSSKGGHGDNFNELRFEDKKGKEYLYIHAEKDETIVVENDKSEQVGHDESISIGNDRKETVGRHETISVAKNRQDTVGADETRAVGDNRKRQVGKNENVSVGENRVMNVGKNHTETIDENQTISVKKSRGVNVKENESKMIGKEFLLDAGDSIILKTGKAQILMKKDGTIVLQGKDITIKGSGQINIKASKDVTLKGSKVTSN